MPPRFTPHDVTQALHGYRTALTARLNTLAGTDGTPPSIEALVAITLDYANPVFEAWASEYKAMLAPCFPSNAPLALMRVGSPHDGGYVMPYPGEGGVAYSLGICDNADWDAQMAQRGFSVFMYDGSITAPPCTHPLFHFYPRYIRTTAGPDATTLQDAIQSNGHAQRRDMILKADIEGAEWDMLQAMPTETRTAFRIIVLELHLTPLTLMLLPNFIESLRALHATHQCVHIHANNNRPAIMLGAQSLCYVYEATFLRRDGQSFTPSDRHYPLAGLDAPCTAHAPEIALGTAGQWATVCSA